MIKEKKYRGSSFLQQWSEGLPAGKNFYYDYNVSTGHATWEQFAATIGLQTVIGQDGIKSGIIYNRTPVPGNHISPFLELAFFSGKCFYPVQLFREDQEWRVANINALTKSWKGIKEQLLLEFEGSVAASVIRQTETVLEDPALLGKIYNEDLFLKLYFSLIREQPVTDTVFQFGLPLIPGTEAVLFNGRQTVAQDAGDVLVLSIDAACIDPRTYGALIYGKCTGASATRNELSVEGGAKLRYQLDNGTLLIKEITAGIELIEPSGAAKSWQIKINTHNYE